MALAVSRSLASDTTPTGAVGGPRILLHLEGAALLVAATAIYGTLGGAWATYALLFLLPDVAMLGYLAGPRVGAAAYNVAHTTLSPLALAAVAGLSGQPQWGLVALIWLAHVGFDRMFGYGLKYASGFTHTHLSGDR